MAARPARCDLLVEPPGRVNAAREAADAAIFALGGYQAVADVLHTSADFLRRLRASRKGDDLRDLITMVGRAEHELKARAGRRRVAGEKNPPPAVGNRPGGGGKPGDGATVRSSFPPPAPALFNAIDPAALACFETSQQLAVVIGLPRLAAVLGMPADQLARRLAGPDMELAVLIEAVVIPDFPRTTTT